jgi:CheY-like chemotaxis protein
MSAFRIVSRGTPTGLRDNRDRVQELPHHNKPSSPAWRVNLMGFAGQERHALAMLIEQSTGRTTAFELTDSPEDASFIIANSDRSAVIDLLVAARRVADTVLVGHHARQGTAGWLERPIDPVALFRVLDNAAQRKTAERHIHRSALAPGSPNPPPATTSSLRGITHADLTMPWMVPGPSQAAALGLSSAANVTTLSDLEAFSPSFSHASHLPRGPRLQAVPKRVPPGPEEPLLALVVDPDDVACQHLRMLLQGQSIATERCVDLRHALVLATDQVFDLIVIDATLGHAAGIQGLCLAQTLKRQPRGFGEACPPVFVVTAQASSTQQAQAMLAGVDAYLPKPVEARALVKALQTAELRTELHLSAKLEMTEGVGHATLARDGVQRADIKSA